MSVCPRVANGGGIDARGIACEPRRGWAESGINVCKSATTDVRGTGHRIISVCQLATTDVGGTGHCIISLGRGVVSPSGNVDRGNASPMRVGGFGLKRNPECVEVLLEAVNGQGKVRRVDVAETILQALNGRDKCCSLFAELSIEALHIRREWIGPIAQVRDYSATDIDEIRFGGGGMRLHSQAETIQLCQDMLCVGS